jgi:putative heme-binding domain-containing protein
MKWSCAALVSLLMVTGASADTLELHKGEHICLIGTALADRMQHHGWLETLIQARFPEHNLVFRDLGFNGDELTVRLRSAGFGSPDEWLTSTKADVIFVFFGYNESFAGSAGLNKFKQDLDQFIKHTLAQKYNGKSAPRLVLFSPIAHENLRDRNLPDGQENNQRLKLYSHAMAEVAKADKVLFVDLFSATQEQYGETDKRWTINGVHLSDFGDKMLARIIDKALFGQQANGVSNDPGDRGVNTPRSPERLEKLRAAVLDKNLQWFLRYRTVDGFNVYGGRSYLKYVDDISNRDVMQREMQILDVMTANRDKRIWAIAQGKDIHVDYSNLPASISVKTNKPGAGPNGTHIFLGGEEAIKQMHVASGMKVNLFASEEMFPELAKPVAMAFDTRGRLWVAVWPTYPHWKPGEARNDKLLIFEDTDGDGKADKCTIFADHLHCPTGFEFWNGGVLVAEAPDLLFLKDTTGKGRADYQERVLGGLDSADTHHTANSFVFDPGGALYFQEGVFHRTQVESPYAPPQRCADAGVYRYEPRSQKFEVYVSYPFANPHGHVFDRWGQDLVTDGTGNENYYAPAFSGHVDYPRKHPEMQRIFHQRTRPSPGTGILSSRHFPDDMQGNYLVTNVIGFQGILQYKISEKGSGYSGTELEPIVYSTDPNFRPDAVKIGPDGAMYFLDWQNPIIGHMQHHLRDPSRDQTHGRIYRVTYPTRPLLKPVKIAGEPIERLLDLLKEPEDNVRYRTRIELGARDTDQVIAAAKKWMDALDKSDKDYEHNLLEALWLHQNHNVVDEALLKRTLHSPDYHARSAATRVLRAWRDRLPDVLDLLEAQIHDEHPQVRLMAVVALSDFQAPRAAEIALEVLQKPTDYYLDYALKETMTTLESYWKPILTAGKPLAANNPAGVNYLFRNINTAELVKLPRSEAVYAALLSRAGVLPDYREEALKGLAKTHKTDEVAELLNAMERSDRANSAEAMTVLNDLGHLLLHHAACDLEDQRPRLEKLATNAHQAYTRQIAYAGLVLSDNGVDKTWKWASGVSDDPGRTSTGVLTHPARLRDLIDAVPAIPDPKLRAAFYSKVQPLLNDKDENLRRSAIKAITFIEGHEGETFAALARFIKDGRDREEAVRALRRIPRGKWPTDQIRPLLAAVIDHIGHLSGSERTQPAALDELQLGNDLASVLPLKEAKEARSKLGELGVSVVLVRTVPHKMVYDRTKFYVEAGKPVVVILENTDIMPHNLVITAPGAMAEVGMESERLAAQADAFNQKYLPKSSKILHASALLQPSTTERLQFTAPKKPGEYPYICTFPGHWRLMYGTMHVVPKLADVPASELQTPVEAEPNARPFVRNWTIDDLVPFLDQLDHGRSFENGKKLFTAASCVQCHTVGKDGAKIGPDLNELPKKLAEKKFSRQDILREIIRPSEVINENFKTYQIETIKGELFTGVIVSQDDKVIRIVTNPLEKPKEIPIKDIDEKRETKVSLMPEGLLTTLSKDEILDLLAYITTGADPEHRAFKK